MALAAFAVQEQAAESAAFEERPHLAASEVSAAFEASEVSAAFEASEVSAAPVEQTMGSMATTVAVDKACMALDK